MVDDPYKVLGIPRDADKDTIKKAYRKMAKNYHPDLHPDDPTANDKMNEINEAYDMLNNPEKYRRRQAGPGSSGSRTYEGPYQNPYGSNPGGGQWYTYENFGDFEDIFSEMFGYGRTASGPAKPQQEAYDSEKIRRAVEALNMGDYLYADRILKQILSERRDARWHYLSALAAYGQGNQIAALDLIEKAVLMEPNNLTYRSAKQAMSRTGETYHQNGRPYRSYNVDFSQCCWSLCAMQFCCAFCHC